MSVWRLPEVNTVARTCLAVRVAAAPGSFVSTSHYQAKTGDLESVRSSSASTCHLPSIHCLKGLPRIGTGCGEDGGLIAL